MIAVLVPEDGATIDAAAIQDIARRDLAGFKRPRHIEVVAELPRNTMGKVQKNQLREKFAAAFQPVAS